MYGNSKGNWEKWYEKFLRYYSKITAKRLADRISQEFPFENSIWICDEVVGQTASGDRKFKKYEGFEKFYAYCRGHTKYSRINHFVFVRTKAK
ncbi:MAG: hypothetical protein J7L14_03685 [Candidatus Diapherotrites archaeon]|nr:hypothetical protein [Candidatus Diapherotrites archaeon]